MISLLYLCSAGPIPQSFEKLPYLETLIINDNELTGRLEDVTFPRTIKLLDVSSNQISGSVSSTFLQNVPASVEVQVDLTDNQITSIDERICTKSSLNRGDVGRYGCNGLLCPIEYYSNTGRHSSLGGCVFCPSAIYLGSTECLDNAEPGAALWAPLVIGLLIMVGILVILVKRKISREFIEQEEDDVESLILETSGELT